ncbi:MAG TPA: hypothetical protein VI076_02675 [Actinopolymorphaceae bacterium]
MAAWLLVRRRRAGLTLAASIMISDLAANLTYVVAFEGEVPGMWRLVLFACFLFGTAPYLRRHLPR